MRIRYLHIIRQKHLLSHRLVAFPKFLYILLGCFLTACHFANENLPSPANYNLNRPSTIKLPAYLSEISGVAYYQKDNSVFAISDEKAWLYKIFLSNNMAIQKWKLGDKADYEDLVLLDSNFYVLQSKGNIIRLHFNSPDSITTNEYKLSLPGKNEFEILYADKEQNRLIMLCKDCEGDDKNSLSAYAFDLSSMSFTTTPAYVIDVRLIESLMQEKKLKFKPSAAAINPVTGKLYIISSINKVLAIANREGVPEKLYRISPELYKQPEGLTFSPQGHLIISNESANSGAADIMIFKYKQGQ